MSRKCFFIVKLNNQVLIFNLINHPTFDFNYKDFETDNTLIMLSAISQANVLNELLQKEKLKDKVNGINIKNENALIISIKRGYIDRVKLLLKYHININQQDISGDKYLIKLCQEKADYNIKNNKDLTPSISEYNVSKVFFNKNKDNFIFSKTKITYKDLDKELIFKNPNQSFYPLNIDKKELLKELVIGFSTL
ncbi:hypothetical protein BCR36DRAFT_397752 [Piromyces finnis]|uniref:Uncharacterized protein n=1 Tax=Piromyces finnis TaxID=1754191 RepID=A0A1Y1V9F8_9FUNG|nr:hypothetical protein BCR36DRAFT_397752 [Piromyces finnis]|eukprot:ORX49655.1 hypothetical protein BCR36DRAFT_397752 [Piromyces finnis]